MQLGLRRVMLGLMIGVLYAPAVYYFIAQSREDALVREYLESSGLVGLSLGKQTAERIAAQVRRDFNTAEDTFTALDYESSPFLRHDTHFLLTHREGTCGQGTRVIINLLLAMGFEDVTRITLYDRYLNASHTLLAVRDGDRSYLVDSINTRPWFTAFLESHDVYVDQFPIMSHFDSMAMRRAWVDEIKAKEYDEEWSRIFERFWTYSYEATPLSKILGSLGLRIQAFSLERPSPTISRLAERPSELLMLCSGALATFILTVGILLRRPLRSLIRLASRNRFNARSGIVGG